VRPRQPLAQPPAVQHVVPLPAEIAVAVGVVDERSRRASDVCHFPLVTLVAQVHLRLDGL